MRGETAIGKYFSVHSQGLGRQGGSSVGYGQQGTSFMGNGWQGASCNGLQALGANCQKHLIPQRWVCPPPLGGHEQASTVATVTSGVTAEEGNATKHHPLLLSLPWEGTCPVVATAKGSGYCLHLPKVHCHFLGLCNKEQPAPPLHGTLPLSRAQKPGIGY